MTTLLNGADGPSAAAAAKASEEDIAEAKAAAAEQGAVVKALKEAKKAGDATKEEVDAAVAELLARKAKAEALENPPPRLPETFRAVRTARWTTRRISSVSPRT